MEIKTLYNSWSNAFDQKEKVNGKVSKRLSQFRDLSKKLVQKAHILTLHRVSHSEELRILDLRSISIGVPTVKTCDFQKNHEAISKCSPEVPLSI